MTLFSYYPDEVTFDNLYVNIHNVDVIVDVSEIIIFSYYCNARAPVLAYGDSASM